MRQPRALRLSSVLTVLSICSSLYYAGRYEEAASQFRTDVSYNPNDTEESLWTWLSDARRAGPDLARKQFLEVGRDPRPLLRVV